jgi:putative glutamine transport system substrate-binding protein
VSSHTQPPRRRRGPSGLALAILLALVAIAACLLNAPAASADPTDDPTDAPPATEGPSPPMTFDAPPGSDLRKILDRGYIRVGVKYDIPTFGLRNLQTSKVEGFEPDLARYIAAALFGDPNAARLEQGLNNRIPFLQADKFDLVIFQLTITPTRAAQVSFSDVYYLSQLRLVAKRDSGWTLCGPWPASRSA